MTFYIELIEYLSIYVVVANQERFAKMFYLLLYCYESCPIGRSRIDQTYHQRKHHQIMTYLTRQHQRKTIKMRGGRGMRRETTRKWKEMTYGCICMRYCLLYKVLSRWDRCKRRWWKSNVSSHQALIDSSRREIITCQIWRLIVRRIVIVNDVIYTGLQWSICRYNQDIVYLTQNWTKTLWEYLRRNMIFGSIDIM